MHTVESWEASLQTIKGKWDTTHGPSWFKKYSTECAAFLCSPCFEETGKHWFCGDRKIYDYALCSLIMFANDVEVDENKRLTELYYRKFSKMLSSCVPCRIKYQCCPKALMELLINEVGVKREGALMLLKELQRKDDARFCRELQEPAKLVDVLTEIMWCEKWMISESLFRDKIVVPGIFTAKYEKALSELKPSPGFLALAFSEDKVTRTVAFDHIRLKILPAANDIFSVPTQLVMYYRMFHAGLKMQLEKSDSAADIAFFRAASITKLFKNYSFFVKTFFNACTSELKTREVCLRQGSIYFLTTVFEIFEEQNRDSNTSEMTIGQINRLAALVASKSEKDLEFKGQTVEEKSGDSPELEYESLTPEHISTFFGSWITYQVSITNINEIANIIEYFISIKNPGICSNVCRSLFDFIATQPKKFYSPFVAKFGSYLMRNFTKLNDDSIALLWRYQCSLHDNSTRNETLSLWSSSLSSEGFSRYIVSNNGSHIELVAKLLESSNDISIPMQENANVMSPDSTYQQACTDIIKEMLESLVDRALPNTLVNILKDKMALKTIIIMWTRQDKLSLSAEDFVKQTIDDTMRDSMVPALLHWNPLIVLQVINQIQEEAIAAQVSWISIMPGIFKFSLMVLDELYSARDGVDASKNVRLTQALHEFWNHSWQMASGVMKNVRQWCVHFDVVSMLTESLEFCQGLLSKFRLIDADISVAMPVKNDEKSWGWELASPAITCVNNMGDLLKLSITPMLAMAHSIIIQILGLMRSFHVPIPSTLVELFTDLATGKRSNKLDDNQIRDLLTACNISESSISNMIHQRANRLASKSAAAASSSSSSSSSSSISTTTSSATSASNANDPHTRLLNAIRGRTVSSGITSRAQSSIGDFFKLSNGNKPPPPPERTIVNNTIVPKVQHSAGINAVRAQLETQKSAQIVKRPIASNVVIHPARPPGFNNIKKPSAKDTAKERVVNLVSDDDDDDDDDDDEVDGALSVLGAIPKNADQISAKLREAYRGKRKVLSLDSDLTKSNAGRDPKKLTRDEEEALMKKRLMVTADGMFKDLLKWDVFGSTPASIQSRVSIPSKFDSVEQYQSVMTPLLLLETWEQIQNSTVECTGNKSTVELPIHFGKRVKVDEFSDAYVSVAKSKFVDASIQESDLLILAYDPNSPGSLVKPDKSLPHCIACVKEGSIKYNKEFVDFQIRMTENNSFLGKIYSGSIVSAISIGSIVTQVREYLALAALPYYNLLDEILAAKPAITKDDEQEIKRIQYEQKLNMSQATAVSRSLHNSGFTLIQGPPGTGKTKTIISIIGAYLGKNMESLDTNVYDRKRVLVCAPSNAAVDEVVLRLMDGLSDVHGNKKRFNVVRLAQTSKVSEQIKDVTLENLVSKVVDTTAETADGQLRRDHTDLIAKRNRIREKLSSGGDESTQLSVEEVTTLEAELKKVSVLIRQKQSDLDLQRERLEKARKNKDAQFRKQQYDILSKAEVVCATLSGSSRSLLSSLQIPFDCVIIDEAAQCNELSGLIPLKYGCKKCIMVGDPNQLPPTILSKYAVQLKYNQSLFVRMFDQWKTSPGAVCMLDTQFRMHPDISRFPSAEFYGGLLKDAPGLAERLKKPWHDLAPSFGPYSFFHVEGRHQSAGNSSLRNKNEASFALKLVQFLLNNFDNCGSIGVITPYKEQVNYMRQLFVDQIGSHVGSLVDFNSIDGFQGQEKDIIIMSCVRASDSKTVGFLNDERRLNVAITRAKSSLWILGNTRSLTVDPLWKDLINDAASHDNLFDANDGTMIRGYKPFNIPQHSTKKMISASEYASRKNKHMAEEGSIETPSSKRVCSGTTSSVTTSSSASTTTKPITTVTAASAPVDSTSTSKTEKPILSVAASSSPQPVVNQSSSEAQSRDVQHDGPTSVLLTPVREVPPGDITPQDKIITDPQNSTIQRNTRQQTNSSTAYRRAPSGPYREQPRPRNRKEPTVFINQRRRPMNRNPK